MAISFLKSVVTKLQNNMKRIWKRGDKAGFIKSFRENQESEEAFDAKEWGIRTVPINQIVGSVGRYHDFDSKFQPKQHVPPDRLENIKRVLQKGKPLPPVKLYQIKDEFYVLDGNHRISAAKAFGYREIEGKIVEFIPSKNTLENILYQERAEFNEKTGLPHAISLTELGQYTYLIKQISQHRQYLIQMTKEPVSFEVAALDWYKTIYRPLIAIIERAHLVESFPGRTIADLYAYISVHQWEKGRMRTYGIEIDELIPKNMEDFRKKMSNMNEYEYPEMQRGITAFILINVKAKSEFRIMEKLFALKEVREIHSVHGDVDIIVKFVLKRDLLTSDSEVIAQFVHNKVRSISGVTSTQTLIPGVSKEK